LYINEERTVGKTDAQQQWTAPSKKMQEAFPKGQTVQQIYGKEEDPSRDGYVQGAQNKEVAIIH
jgi:hypothetical protein